MQPACRCPQCKYVQDPPGTGLVLYTGPDAVETLVEAGIRDGWYDDIDALFDDVTLAAEHRFTAAERNSYRAIESARRRVEAVLRGVTP
jgi:hypothetical protein